MCIKVSLFDDNLELFHNLYLREGYKFDCAFNVFVREFVFNGFLFF